ncbi:MAG: O-antigen ligase family protein, partial [Deltaproteobacteria bacterium]|nr:O-antigen ligase family protein [Deltaproteobacteria bacterium]
MIKILMIFLSPVLIVLSSLHYGSPFLFDKLLITLAILFLLTMLVYLTLLESTDGQISLPHDRFYLPVFLFLAYIVIQTVILSPANQRYLFGAILLFFLIVLFFVYLYAGFGKRENSLYLLQSVVYTNSILLFVYLVRAFSRFKVGEHVFSGWLVNHNHVAMLTGMLLPYAIALSVYRHQRIRDRVMWFVSLSIVLISFLFSVSRGAYISFILAITITLLASAWLGLYRKKTAFILLGAGVLAGVFILSLYPFEHSIFSSLFILSASQRLGIWLGSLKMFIHHPFIGWGIGTYGDAFHRFRPADILYFVNHAHNIFIETADDTGIIGLGLLIWILSAWIYALTREMKHTSSDFKKAVLWAGLTSTLFLIFHNFVDFGILVPSNAISALLVMAGTASVMQINSQNLPLDYVKVFSKQQRILVGILAGIFFVSAVVLCSRALYGQYLYEQGKKELSAKPLPGSGLGTTPPLSKTNPPYPPLLKGGEGGFVHTLFNNVFSSFSHGNKGKAQGDARAELLSHSIRNLTRAQRYITTDKVYFETGKAWFNTFRQTGSMTALDNTITQFKRAAQLCPWNPYYPEDIGGLYQYTGDLQDAILYTERSLTLDPSNASLCLRMADLELEQGNEDTAIAYYTKASRIYPPYTWDTLSMLLLSNVALDKIRQTAAALPDGEWVLANELIKTPRVSLGTSAPAETGLLQDNGNADRNIGIAAGILQGLMLSDTANLKRYVPLFLSIIPDKQDALAKLSALHISDTVMLFYLAVLQNQLGYTASATTALSYIIHTDNTYGDAYQLLANIYASENKREDAIEVLKTGLYYL